MSEKKPYSRPLLVQVELKQEQAILAACTVKTTSLSTSNFSVHACRPSGPACRKHSSGQDSVTTS